MAESYLFFEHTDPAVQNAFDAAPEYQRKPHGTYKAYQVPQNVIVRAAGGQEYRTPQDWWLIVGNGEITAMNDTDFQNLFQLKP